MIFSILPVCMIIATLVICIILLKKNLLMYAPAVISILCLLFYFAPLPDYREIFIRLYDETDPIVREQFYIVRDSSLILCIIGGFWFLVIWVYVIYKIIKINKNSHGKIKPDKNDIIPLLIILLCYAVLIIAIFNGYWFIVR